uniref:non-specific serine/threonine protein kinase n=1 Tax=Rhodnius prolixus TaxID=13249 RepID=A0ABL0EJZ1_RHOPR
MSVRHGLSKALSVGRFIFRTWKSHFRWTQNFCQRPSNVVSAQIRVQATSSIQTKYESARKIFANNILRRVTNPVSADLRRKTTKQLLFGNSGPFFAFVGIGLASGSIITKEDELEGLCWEIREAMSRMQNSMAEAESDIFLPNEEIKLNKFSIGKMISKGSNGAVYLAKKKVPQTVDREESVESDGPILVPSEPTISFPYAMKVMFNYDIESRATAILRSMYCETIPARFHFSKCDSESSWGQLFSEKMVTIPPHPNIVSMHCAFADRVFELPDSMSCCSATLPRRINPDGFGRNMSLYLLMKRYDTTLSDYLNKVKPDTREGVLLLTQLLEAIAHINGYGIAHRDIKSNNVLLELNGKESCSSGSEEKGKECPVLALTDFGCCLADSTFGLLQPYISGDMCKGGNPALMAPEVALATPGFMTLIDYSKSDAWAAATLAYEIFLGYNPFYRDLKKNPAPLLSTTYLEHQLPKLDGVPHLVRRVVEALLTRNQRKRVSAALAADVLQLYLWAPNSWLKRADAQGVPRSSEIMQWLLCLTTKVLTTGSFKGRRSQAEYLLIGSFLRRSKISNIRKALIWAQQQL